MKKIGLFGGTFNPVHFGHLNLAIELMERGGLDEVWWIPTPCSPLRMENAPLSGPSRLKMVELAIGEIPRFKVLDLEIHQTPPVYTIDTVKTVQNAHPDKVFFLLLGQDSLAQFMAWREPLELMRQIPLLIGSRAGFPIPTAFENRVVETALLDISATRIRDRIKKRLYIGHLVPAKVLDFIYVNQLYFTV